MINVAKSQNLEQKMQVQYKKHLWASRQDGSVGECSSNVILQPHQKYD